MIGLLSRTRKGDGPARHPRAKMRNRFGLLLAGGRAPRRGRAIDDLGTALRSTPLRGARLAAQAVPRGPKRGGSAQRHSLRASRLAPASKSGPMPTPPPKGSSSFRRLSSACEWPMMATGRTQNRQHVFKGQRIYTTCTKADQAQPSSRSRRRCTRRWRTWPFVARGCAEGRGG